MGPKITWDNLSTSSQLFSKHNSICNLNFPLARNRTWSQCPGIRISPGDRGTSLGDHHSANHMHVSVTSLSSSPTTLSSLSPFHPRWPRCFPGIGQMCQASSHSQPLNLLLPLPGVLGQDISVVSAVLFTEGLSPVSMHK